MTPTIWEDVAQACKNGGTDVEKRVTLQAVQDIATGRHIFAVGDIHGCFAKLTALMVRLPFDHEYAFMSYAAGGQLEMLQSPAPRFAAALSNRLDKSENA